MDRASRLHREGRGFKSLNVHMDDKIKEYKFLLTEMEAAYLNAAVVDFFHKMKNAAEQEVVVLFMDDRYRIAKDLWVKVENQIPIGEWK